MQKFDGKVTIRVNFPNRALYEKFRRYILRTNWSYSIDYPIFEEMDMEFHNIEDYEQINRQIIFLLQNGFNVYCCRYQLNESATETPPTIEEATESYP